MKLRTSLQRAPPGALLSMLPKNDGAFLTRKMRMQIRKGFFGFLGNSAIAVPSLSEV